MYVIIAVLSVLASLAIVIMYCALINASDCDDFEEKLHQNKKNSENYSN